MHFAPVSHLEIILSAFAFASIIVIGLAVYLKNSTSWTNRLFSLLALFLSAYVVVNTLSLHPPAGTAASQFFWIRGDLMLGSMMSLLLFLLVHTFPKGSVKLGRKYLIGLVAFTVLNIAIIAGGLVFTGVSYPNGAPVPVPGPLVVVYGIDFVGIILFSCVLLLRKYMRAVGLEKIRLLYFLYGIVSSFVLLALFTMVNVVVFKSASGIFLGPIFPVLLMGAVGYSIVRHHFLDIQPIIARAVSYTVLVIVLAVLYATVLFFGSTKLLGFRFSVPSVLVSIVLMTIVALTFQPLNKIMRKLTDRFFFRDRYDAEKILSDLAQVIAHNINFDTLAEKLLTTISTELRVTKGAILVSTDGVIGATSTMGYDSATLLGNAPLKAFLQAFPQNKPYFIANDLHSDDDRALFRTVDMEAVFPVFAGKKTVAFIVLGPKLSGIPYSTQDLNVLSAFASDAGVAIKNAKLYSELKQALDSKSQFIKVVSHQLRTPVSGIRWGLEMVREEGNVAKQKAILDTSYEKVIFLGDQLDDILVSLDIIEGNISVTRGSCDILQLCKDIEKEFAPSMVSNNVHLSYVLDDTVPIIDADYNKLKKMLKIVIKNAIVYSHAGGSITIKSAVESVGDKKNVVIAVQDAGIGITEGEKGHLFEEFFRSDRARTKLPDGLGLGLYISKIFARTQGGDIRFESQGEDKGSVFSIVLPV
jgi:signal transduction histidine kinase